MIKRGSRMFVRLAQIGEVDEKDRTVFAVGFKGKRIADPDRPLGMLAIGFIEQIIRMAQYSSREAMLADLESLRSYVVDLRAAELVPVESPAPDPAIQEGE